MLITCPNCSARYLVDSAAIGAEGRTVQCSRCHNQWHADAETNVAGRPPDESPLVEIRPKADLDMPRQKGDEQRGIPTWLKVAFAVAVLAGAVGGAGYALAVSV